MDEMEQLWRWHQEDLERLKNFRLLDDDFLTKCFEGSTDCIRLVLRIILEMPDLEVVEVHTQVFVENLLERSVRLDIVAVDGCGRRFNVEIQRDDRGAGFHRARYHSSMIDVNLLPKGTDFDHLPEVYVIFITERDVIGRGQAVYRVDRYFDTGEPFEDGAHIVYVNGAYRGQTPIGRLMHDFSCTKASDMHYELLADRVSFFKESKKGVAIMCKAMEDMRNESLQEGIRQGIKQGINQGVKQSVKATALRMLEVGKYALEEIAGISGLSLEEVRKLQAERG